LRVRAISTLYGRVRPAHEARHADVRSIDHCAVNSGGNAQELPLLGRGGARLRSPPRGRVDRPSSAVAWANALEPRCPGVRLTKFARKRVLGSRRAPTSGSRGDPAGHPPDSRSWVRRASG
jgi:hypothetical protein